MRINFSFLFLLPLIFCASLHAAIILPVATNLMTGKKIDVAAELKKKSAVVLIFMSTRCPSSLEHMTVAKELSQKYSDIKFFAVHSNPDEPLDTAKQFFKKFSFPFEIVSDREQGYANAFKANKTPHAFILNAKFEIVYQGGITDSNSLKKSKINYLDFALEDFSQHRKLRFPESRTLGCVIARKDEKNEI